MSASRAPRPPVGPEFLRTCLRALIVFSWLHTAACDRNAVASERRSSYGERRSADAELERRDRLLVGHVGERDRIAVGGISDVSAPDRGSKTSLGSAGHLGDLVGDTSPLDADSNISSSVAEDQLSRLDSGSKTSLGSAGDLGDLVGDTSPLDVDSNVNSSVVEDQLSRLDSDSKTSLGSSGNLGDMLDTSSPVNGAPSQTSLGSSGNLAAAQYGDTVDSIPASGKLNPGNALSVLPEISGIPDPLDPGGDSASAETGMRLNELYDFENDQFVFSNAKDSDSGVDIAQPWMDLLFDLIDDDKSGSIGLKEWDKQVKGTWKEGAPDTLLVGHSLRILGGQGPRLEISRDDFNANWDAAIDETMKVMGAAHGVITMEKIDANKAGGWVNGVTKYEKDFAKSDEFMNPNGDGARDPGFRKMDRGEFEEFIYTVMLFRAMDPDGDGIVTWDEIKDMPDAVERFGPLATFNKNFNGGSVPSPTGSSSGAFLIDQPMLNTLSDEALRSMAEDAASRADFESQKKFYREMKRRQLKNIPVEHRPQESAPKPAPATIQQSKGATTIDRRSATERADEEEDEVLDSLSLQDHDEDILQAVDEEDHADKIRSDLHSEADAIPSSSEPPEEKIRSQSASPVDTISSRSDDETVDTIRSRSDDVETIRSGADDETLEEIRSPPEVIADEFYSHSQPPVVHIGSSNALSIGSSASMRVENNTQAITPEMMKQPEVEQPKSKQNKTALQRAFCAMFHKRRLAWGQPEPTWVESRPPGERPFTAGEDTWHLVLLCPKLMEKRAQPPKYQMTPETIVVQVTKGARTVSTWLVSMPDVHMDRQSMTFKVNMGPALDPMQAYPMMGHAIPDGWKPTGLHELAQADCRLSSKFYWIPTPEKNAQGKEPAMAAGKLTPKSKYAGRYDLVSALQCCSVNPCQGDSMRKLYKVFL